MPRGWSGNGIRGPSVCGTRGSTHSGADLNAKTHQTAVVVIPPESCWEPVQAIRREHDRQVRRWMPHITLLYPFLPRSQFDRIESRLSSACATVEPFELRLREIRSFRHRRDSYTLWLAPEPAEPLVQLQAELQFAFPECDDTARHAAGFTPHLSVGQVRGRAAVTRLIRTLEERWSPISFAVDEVCLIWRDPPPEDVFRVDRVIRLGSGR
jgi:2'-5' RNA ligase